jgi:SagB-type dehydrogenase family enzyme
MEEALAVRRSCRRYSAVPVSNAALSQLLWAAYGTTGDDGGRSVPSAGRLYPLEIRIVARRVAGLAASVYRYDADNHALVSMIDGESAEKLTHAVLEEQPWVGQAPLVIAVTANLAVAREHFREQPPANERGARYVYMETGAVAQNLYLQATAAGLGCVLVAGFDDPKVKTALNLPQELEPTALLCLGHNA